MTNQVITQPFLPAILIVDDNPDNLQVLGKLLQESRYEIEFATNGKAALDWLKAKPFDLILLDINMPEMNGFEVCREIRSKPEMNNVPVIFLSAEADRESILKGFELGAQDYVTKPFDSRELLSRVRTHLALKDSIEKLENLNKSLEEKVLERTRQLNDANAKLETLNIQLTDLDKSKSEFLNLISHEIRTPLNGILGPLELLKGPGYPPEVSELVEILDMSVKRLERFSLNAILITRLKTKQIVIKREQIHLLKVINEVLEEEKDKIQSCNAKVLLKDEAAGELIHGEADLVKKSIASIFENALQFSPRDGTIEIKTYIEDQNISCEIKDQGKGFETEAINNAFELFVTGKEYQDNRTGIGLPLTKMIMETHGGDIIIGNNPGGGASVKLMFRKNLEDQTN